MLFNMLVRKVLPMKVFKLIKKNIGAYIIVDVDLSGTNGSPGFPAEAPNITFRNGF